MFSACQLLSTSLVTLMIQQVFCPLAFSGLLILCVCAIKALLCMASWAKLSQALHRPFSSRCLEVNKQMADEHSQSINWLHGHLINVHVTTLQQKFSFLEKFLYKFNVTVLWLLFSVLLSLTGIPEMSISCLHWGLSSRAVKYQLTSNGSDSGELLWEFRLIVYATRMQRTVSYHSCYIWLIVLCVSLLLSYARCGWIRCTEFKLKLGLLIKM